MSKIFHLISESDWESTRDASEWKASSLHDEGFIHCSKDEEQMVRVAQRLYADRADMLALEVDTDQLSQSVVSEPSRSGEIYPHIYGPLQIRAVVAVWRLNPDGSGGFALTEH